MANHRPQLREERSQLDAYAIAERPGAVVATAIHAGHAMRPEVAAACALSDAQRLLEEDPATDRISDIGSTHVVVRASRFQVDLNRVRERAVYRLPAEAWGLTVWRTPLADEVCNISRAEYDRFYSAMHELLERTVTSHGRALLLDVHSYNHRRDGRDAAPAPQAANPDVNVGTAGVDRRRWAAVIDAFEGRLSSAGYDVREDVKFTGGAFVRWAHDAFPDTVCALAVEFKKTFMDEWTGEVDEDAVERARTALCDAANAAETRLAEVRP